MKSSLNEVQRCIMRSSRLNSFKMDVKQLVKERDDWRRKAKACEGIIRRAYNMSFTHSNVYVREVLGKADFWRKEEK